MSVRRPSSTSVARFLSMIVVPLLVLVAVGLVAVSPWALRALDIGADTDWVRLSNIGQTYGAVSAVVAAVALVGVTVSVAIQVREARANRKNAQRVLHNDLLRMAMDDPLFMDCWGPYLTESTDAERQYAYVNLVVSHWYSSYQIGELPGDRLRSTALSVFTSAPGRHYWRVARPFWRDNYPGRRARRFCTILDEAYGQAAGRPLSTRPAVAGGAVAPAGKPEPARHWPGWVLLAAVGAVLGYRAVRQVRLGRGRGLLNDPTRGR